MKINRKISDTKNKEYNERKALYALCDSLDNILEKDDDEQIIIIVNGIKHAFYAGSPQIEGLLSFINHVCEENMYQKLDEPFDTYKRRIMPIINKIGNISKSKIVKLRR